MGVNYNFYSILVYCIIYCLSIGELACDVLFTGKLIQQLRITDPIISDFKLYKQEQKCSPGINLLPKLSQGQSSISSNLSYIRLYLDRIRSRNRITEIEYLINCSKREINQPKIICDTNAYVGLPVLHRTCCKTITKY